LGIKYIILYLLIVSNVYADDTLREKFLSANKLVWQAQSNHYQKLYQQLNDYPLQPYLDQKRLMHRMSIADKNEIAVFLEKYRSTPLDWPLRKKWLKYLAKRKQKKLFLSFFKSTNNIELTCQFYQFQLAQGMPEQVILPKITPLWLVGKSQPKVCDPLFKRWQEAGYRTTAIILQRIKLAAKGGKHTLIPYLSKLLPKNKQYLATLWHKVRRNPAYITQLLHVKKTEQQTVEIIVYGLKRLIWRNPDKAIRTYKKALRLFSFTLEQKQQLTKKFALALASKHHPKAIKWLDKVSDHQLTEDLVQWRLAEVLKKQNWSKIYQTLNGLPVQYRESLQWKYWYARSFIERGNIERGKFLLTLLANERHYYGFMAASYLNKSINIQNNPLKFSVLDKKIILKNLAAQRAIELFNLGWYQQARREWSYWLTQLSKREKLIAATIAHEKGWYDRAIFTLAEQGYLDDVDLRFPKAFAKEINYFSAKEKIAPSWVFAIARRESSFMVDARSGAGALGLMQILPSTAKQLLREKNLSRRHLLKAKNNIKLGTKYLKKLLKKQKGNLVLATASYNAGPYRVDTWLKNKPKLPADIWIETIPYKETREYVKSVLAYQQIYQFNSQQNMALFDQVVNMEIGD